VNKMAILGLAISPVDSLLLDPTVIRDP
jgi:hypothetical protein